MTALHFGSRIDDPFSPPPRHGVGTGPTLVRRESSVTAGAQTWDTLQITPRSTFEDIANCALRSAVQGAEPRAGAADPQWALYAQKFAAAILPSLARRDTTPQRSRNVALIMRAIAKGVSDEAARRSTPQQLQRVSLPEGSAQLFEAVHLLIRSAGLGKINFGVLVSGFQACRALRSTAQTNAFIETLAAHLRVATLDGRRLGPDQIAECAAGLHASSDGELSARVASILAVHIRALADRRILMWTSQVSQALNGIHRVSDTAAVEDFLHAVASQIDRNFQRGQFLTFAQIGSAVSGLRAQAGGNATDRVLRSLSSHLMPAGRPTLNAQSLVAAMDGIANLDHSEAVAHFIVRLADVVSVEAAKQRFMPPESLAEALYALRKTPDSAPVLHMIDALMRHGRGVLPETSPLSQEFVAKALCGLSGKALDGSDRAVNFTVLKLTKYLAQAGSAGRYLANYDSLRAARGIAGRAESPIVDNAVRAITGHVVHSARATGKHDADALQAVAHVMHAASPAVREELVLQLSVAFPEERH